jgi:hypothetical protein
MDGASTCHTLRRYNRDACYVKDEESAWETKVLVIPMDLKRYLEILSLAVGAVLVIQTIRRNERADRVDQPQLVDNTKIFAPRTSYHSGYAKFLRGEYL